MVLVMFLILSFCILYFVVINSLYNKKNKGNIKKYRIKNINNQYFIEYKSFLLGWKCVNDFHFCGLGRYNINKRESPQPVEEFHRIYNMNYESKYACGIPNKYYFTSYSSYHGFDHIEYFHSYDAAKTFLDLGLSYINSKEKRYDIEYFTYNNSKVIKL